MDYITTTLKPYFELFPYAALSFLISFLITPLVGFICKKYGIVDLPAQMRSPTETGIKSRIKKIIVPRAGGLAIFIGFLILLPIVHEINRELVGLLIATCIIVIGGFLDDKYTISSRTQFIFQILAAVVIIASGISIDSINNPLGQNINLRYLVIPLGFIKDASIALPADIFTIIWILMIINAINWLFGSDGLGEGISFIALMTIFMISIKISTPLVASVSIITASALLGFIPYNLPPSKIFSGTTGTNLLGFLVAVLAIMGGAKVSAAIIVLIIPIIDMIWVMIGRIQRSQLTSVFDILKVTTKGDDTHLHHRLLKLGFNSTQVALIEWTAVLICAIVAFITANLPKMVIIGIIAVVVVIIFFIISLLLKKGVKVTGSGKKDGGSGDKDEPPSGAQETPESKYAY